MFVAQDRPVKGKRIDVSGGDKQPRQSIQGTAHDTPRAGRQTGEVDGGRIALERRLSWRGQGGLDRMVQDSQGSGCVGGGSATLRVGLRSPGHR